MKPVGQGETFEVRHGRRVDTYRREADDAAPVFECERIRVTHLACSVDAKMTPYTFGTEPEWFVQRGLVAASARRAA